jgi:hypothetical protein
MHVRVRHAAGGSQPMPLYSSLIVPNESLYILQENP